MAFTIHEAYLPARLTATPMTDAQFSAFCSEHPDLFFEMTAEGDILVMPPNHTLTGIRNSAILKQLSTWAALDGRGIVADSSAGFVLPNGARRSPDASWIAKPAIRQLPAQTLESFWHLTPAFVIELRSHSDRLVVLREKMLEYIGNGCELGWLVNPDAKEVEIFRPGHEPCTLRQPESVTGEGPVEGFVLDLDPVWNPL